jgi:hypothetical protein
MAFIVLRRSRNTRSYLLIESYRDDRGKTLKRTLCYLGRELSEENARAARRAFVWWARRYHHDSGGSHEGFLRAKDAYDRALAAWAGRAR